MSNADTSQVTIHKRNRYSDGNSTMSSQTSETSSQEAPKKKKYRIVPNSFTSPPSTALSSETKKSPPADVIDVDSELPKDRTELLRFVRLKKKNKKNHKKLALINFSLLFFCS